MATKDWEKQRDVKNLVKTWTNQVKRGELVEIYKQGNNTWKGSVMMGNAVIIRRNFKTKAQAMRFARAYMRSH